MDPGGFEPPTPGLKGQCSNRAELWIHNSQKNKAFLNYSKSIILKPFRLDYENGIVRNI